MTRRMKLLWWILFLIPIISFIIFITQFHFDQVTIKQNYFEVNGMNRSILMHDESSTCKNTFQGNLWMTDDRGFTCLRDLWNASSGCCNDISLRFSCQSCVSNYSCCIEYEYCVSCCLDAFRNSKESFKDLIRTLSDRYQIMNRIKIDDLFDYCLIRCRTNSKNIVHFRLFRSEYKYCFNDKDSPLIIR